MVLATSAHLGGRSIYRVALLRRHPAGEQRSTGVATSYSQDWPTHLLEPRRAIGKSKGHRKGPVGGAPLLTMPAREPVNPFSGARMSASTA